LGKMLIGATLIVIVGAACSRDRTQSTSQAAAVPAAEITVIGCVQPADTTATNEAGVNDTKYMLTHSKPGTSDATRPTGTSGSSAAAQPVASTYRLSGSDATLSSDVGHEVEVVAIVEDPAGVPSGTIGTSRTSGPAPKLKVETVKMIALPCPQ
jgi:hypothetical protein